MKKTNSLGFTLVELIVVITILAILGTIGFLSFGSYSADARDAKRTSDLKNLQQAIVTKKTQGANLLSFVTTVTQNQILGTSAIAGTTIVSAPTASYTYDGGSINFGSLEVSSAEFNDPQNSTGYRIGATSRLSGKYQLAANLENAGTPIAQVIGDYVPRTAAITVTNTSGSATFTISSATNYNKIKVGDYVGGDITAGAGGTTCMAAGNYVTSVSADGSTITLNTASTPAACAELYLGSNVTPAYEPEGLIDDGDATASSTTEVTDASTTNLPY